MEAGGGWTFVGGHQGISLLALQPTLLGAPLGVPAVLQNRRSRLDESFILGIRGVRDQSGELSFWALGCSGDSLCGFSKPTLSLRRELQNGGHGIPLGVSFLLLGNVGLVFLFVVKKK